MIKALLMACTSAQVTSNIPIYPLDTPGWWTGQNSLGIEIELFGDLLCPDTAEQNTMLIELMDMEWNGKKVSEQVVIKTTPFVLVYHLHSFSVTQAMVYFMDRCQSSNGKICLMNEYKNKCLADNATIRGMDTTSTDSFNAWWVD